MIEKKNIVTANFRKEKKNNYKVLHKIWMMQDACKKLRKKSILIFWACLIQNFKSRQRGDKLKILLYILTDLKKNSTPSPWKCRKTTSSAFFCATGAWGLNCFSGLILRIQWAIPLLTTSAETRMSWTFTSLWSSTRTVSPKTDSTPSRHSHSTATKTAKFTYTAP